MTIIFVLWSDESCRSVIEERGLFPEGLKRAFSVDYNAHGAMMVQNSQSVIIGGSLQRGVLRAAPFLCP